MKLPGFYALPVTLLALRGAMTFMEPYNQLHEIFALIIGACCGYGIGMAWAINRYIAKDKSLAR